MRGLQQLGLTIWRSSVAWSMGAILLRFIGFALVMGVALPTLSRDALGLWYGMVSLTALTGCIELGFSSTISRLASYYFAGARQVPSLGLASFDGAAGEPNVGALRALIAEARRIYRLLAVVYLVLTTAASLVWIWLLPTGQPLAAEAWLALGLLIAGGALNLSAMFWPFVLQGIHEVRVANIYLAAGLLSGYAVGLIGLLSGAGLMALAASLVGQTLVTRWLARRKVLQWFASRRLAPDVALSWRDFWPMTWRAGVAQAASQLVLPATPLIVTTFSLGAAASYGFSVQVALMLHLVAASWIAVKWPLLGSLRVAGHFAAVRRLAAGRIGLTMVSFVLGAALVPFVAPLALSSIGSQTPFVSPTIWLMLAVAAGIDLFVGAHAGLILTGNRVSHMAPFAITGLLTVTLATILAPVYGTAGVVASAIACPLLINVWWLPREAWGQLRNVVTASGPEPGR